MKPLKRLGLTAYDEAVHTAYFTSLKVARLLLATIEREELRYSLIREDPITDTACILHEFVNPLIYLRLERGLDKTLSIRYGFEPCKDYAHVTVAFTRTLYKVTMKDTTSLNIENSIKTEWYVHNPDEMYAYIEEQMKHHSFSLIKHKPTASQRKQLLHAVA